MSDSWPGVRSSPLRILATSRAWCSSRSTRRAVVFRKRVSLRKLASSSWTTWAFMRATAHSPAATASTSSALATSALYCPSASTNFTCSSAIFCQCSSASSRSAMVLAPRS